MPMCQWVGFPQSGLPVPDACFIVNSIWMLTDFSRENGATQLIPYTHHSRRVPRPGVDYKQHRVAAEGPARSVVIFHGSIWHRGGANVTQDKQRVGLSIPFTPTGWTGGRRMALGMKRSVRETCHRLVQQMSRRVVEG